MALFRHSQHPTSSVNAVLLVLPIQMPIITVQLPSKNLVTNVINCHVAKTPNYMDAANHSFSSLTKWNNQIKIPLQKSQIIKRSKSHSKTQMEIGNEYYLVYRPLAFFTNKGYCKKFPEYEFQGLILFDVNVRVNKMVLEDIDAIFPSLLRNIRTSLNNNPKIRSVFFTGHGIALASLAGFRWALERDKIVSFKLWPETNFTGIGQAIFTFGAPRVGNSAMSLLMNQGIVHQRITYGNDHVPQYPPVSMDWKHFGSEIWIEQSNNCYCPDKEYVYWDCNNLSIPRSQKSTQANEENMECNAGQSIENVPDEFFHYGPYFGVKMGDCTPFQGAKNIKEAWDIFQKTV
ncbi:hypothetical protein G9A89_000872 [Geosiphon pyriformis]|nr:hypothetical protein G9A89_000872 [Geosiphon pyriformis]